VEAVADGQATLAIGDERVVVEKGEASLFPGQVATFIIRPEKMVLSAPDQAPPEALSAVVQEVVYIGTDTRYLVALPSGESAIVRVQNGCQTETGQYAQGDRLKVHWLPEDARTLAD